MLASPVAPCAPSVAVVPVVPVVPPAVLDVPPRVLVPEGESVSRLAWIVRVIAQIPRAYLAAVRAPRTPHPDPLEDAWEAAYWPLGHPIDGHPRD